MVMDGVGVVVGGLVTELMTRVRLVVALTTVLSTTLTLLALVTVQSELMLVSEQVEPINDMAVGKLITTNDDTIKVFTVTNHML